MSHLGVIMEISINKIRHSTFQLRTSLEGLEELASSIKQYGLLQPIVIRPMQGEYEVVAGNRRLAAAKLLKLRKISSHMVDLSDKEAFEMGLVENVHHRTMDPIEEALAFDQYSKDRGWGGITDLSKRIGKSQEFVTKRIQLLRLPQNIRNEIIRQRISPSIALELLPLNSESIQEFADFVIKKPLTKLEVRKIVRSSASKKEEDFEMDQPQAKFNHEHELYLIDKTLRKSIALMKSTLMNFDEILSNVNDDWILKELLMQYRMIIHGDIDTFLKLRKRLRMKIPRDYLNISKHNSHAPEEPGNGGLSGDKIYHWATRGVWQ
jgi:ParB family transcriptional regulator, chromosome partitioning protein